MNSTCPLAYRYGAKSIKKLEAVETHTLYVVGGLYGNPHALNSIKQLFNTEINGARLCFNGDFHWFNIAPNQFQLIQQEVMQHDAICGNVEYELGAENYSGGCGCSYPDSVSPEIVQRSDAIHRRLSETARDFPEATRYFSQLSMVKKYCVDGTTVAVIHGDADSLAGWNFDASMIDTDAVRSWTQQAFTLAEVDVFASSHTGSALMRRFNVYEKDKLVVNNGSAGAPNFTNAVHGVITRISSNRYQGKSLASERIGETWIEALPVLYNQNAWLHDFLTQWPENSDAYASYWPKITLGPNYTYDRAYESLR